MSERQQLDTSVHLRAGHLLSERPELLELAASSVLGLGALAAVVE